MCPADNFVRVTEHARRTLCVCIITRQATGRGRSSVSRSLPAPYSDPLGGRCAILIPQTSRPGRDFARLHFMGQNSRNLGRTLAVILSPRIRGNIPHRRKHPFSVENQQTRQNTLSITLDGAKQREAE